MNGAHVVEDASINDYHANDRYHSKTRLKDFDARGPAYFRRRWIDKSLHFGDSEALRIGRAFDTIFDSEADYERQYLVQPANLDRRTKGGKAWVAEAEMSGKEVISADDDSLIRTMKRNALQNESAVALLEGCKSQLTMRAEWCEHFGIQSRIDFTNLEGNDASGGVPYLLDLKSTRSVRGFERDIHTFAYDGQQALGRMIARELGIPKMKHFLLISEKQGGRQAQVLELTSEYVDIGEAWCRGVIGRLERCYAEDHWPVTECEYRVVEPPRWLVHQYQG